MEHEVVSIINGDTHIGGAPEVVAKLFTSMSNYLAEVKNPANTAVNPFLKNKYAPLDEVLNTVRPVLAKHGLAISQFPTFNGDYVSVGTILAHKDGGYIVYPPVSVPITKKDAVSVVAGVTYARRCSLNAVLGIHGEADDDGSMASGLGQKKSSKGRGASEEPTDGVKKLIDEISAKAKTLIEKGYSRDDFYEKVAGICGTKLYNKVNDEAKLKAVVKMIDKLEA